MTPLVTLEHVSLSYGSVRALHDLSLKIERGEVHAIVGEHGAGKSSVINVLGGLCRPDNGTVVVNGNTFRSLTVPVAQSEGISLVKQGVCLCDHMSVAKNIYMNQPGFYRRHRWSRQRAEESVAEYLAQHNVTIDPELAAGTLKLADKVLTEVMRASYRQPRLLILDESLEKLTAHGLECVFGVMSEIRERGGSILFVTHRIDDIFQIADRVSVIRQGEVLITEAVSDIDKFSLVKMAYTQLPATAGVAIGDDDFYHLLKYNQAILENLPINLVVVNKDLDLKLVNKQASSYFGVPGGPNPGTNLKSVFREDADLFERIVAAIGSPEGSTLFNEPFVCDGEARVLNVSVVPIRDESWRIGTILMIEDATEREKLREQVFLSEKIGSIGILAAGIAHEICNPLEIISNDITYLKTLYGESIDLSILQEIKEEVESMTRIVRNLDRIPGNPEPETEPVVPGALIQSVLTFVSPVAGQQGVRIEFRDETDGYVIESHSDDIRQILLNLVKNALEATERGGRVAVEARVVDRFLEVNVVDDGPGIPPQERNHIFLPFFSTKNRSRVNRGLGLYVSYQLTSRNGGQIEVGDPRPGSTDGCRFTIRLPLARDTAGHGGPGSVFPRVPRPTRSLPPQHRRRR